MRGTSPRVFLEQWFALSATEDYKLTLHYTRRLKTHKGKAQPTLRRISIFLFFGRWKDLYSMCYISNTDGDEPFFAFYLLTMYSGLYKSNNPVEHDLYQILQTRIFSKKAVDFFSWSDRNPSVFTGKMGVQRC